MDEIESVDRGRQAILPDRPTKLLPAEANSTLGRLVDAYARQLIAIVESITGDHHASEEIVQDSFLKLHQRILRKKVDVRLIVWVRKVAINAAIDFTRKRQKQPWETPFEEDDIDPALALLTERELEMCRKIGTRLNRLSEQKRSIFEMKVFDGMTYGEISAVVRRSPEAVRKTYDRVSENIRRALRDYE